MRLRLNAASGRQTALKAERVRPAATIPAGTAEGVAHTPAVENAAAEVAAASKAEGQRLPAAARTQAAEVPIVKFVGCGGRRGAA